MGNYNDCLVTLSNEIIQGLLDLVLTLSIEGTGRLVE